MNQNRHNSSSTRLPALPKSWSELTWQQLGVCWQMKLRYGGNQDVARVAALMALLQLKVINGKSGTEYDERTGEPVYYLYNPANPKVFYSVTPRELSYYAKRALPWFDFPYGDHGDKEKKDDKGNIIKERREGIKGYVSNMKDAMILPQELFKVRGSLYGMPHWFQLPQAACANLTWEQYRALQIIVPQLFADGNTDEQTVSLHAQFLANILTPRSFAIFDTMGGNIKIRPHWVYQYNSRHAESLALWFRRKLSTSKSARACSLGVYGAQGLSILFHICFQVYQTALSYYETSYPLLFGGGGKQDPLKDALTGEVGTINTIMKYQGYTKPEDVYAENIPIILDVLNTMTKEAKEIEKMNAKIKKK